jgi:hypothetical protein
VATSGTSPSPLCIGDDRAGAKPWWNKPEGTGRLKLLTTALFNDLTGQGIPWWGLVTPLRPGLSRRPTLADCGMASRPTLPNQTRGGTGASVTPGRGPLWRCHRERGGRWFGPDVPAARIPARLCVCSQPDPSTTRFISGPHKTKCLRDAGSGRQRTHLVPGVGRGVPRLPPHHPSSTPRGNEGPREGAPAAGGRGPAPARGPRVPPRNLHLLRTLELNRAAMATYRARKRARDALPTRINALLNSGVELVRRAK